MTSTASSSISSRTSASRPRVAEDVLVERLPGPDAEDEPAVELHGRGGGGLGEHRRVNADRRAGHRRGDGQVDRLGQRADHRPHERALALVVVPRVEVVETHSRSKPASAACFACRTSSFGPNSSQDKK